jgi:N-acetyl-anhydromuramyl-L-alanine amidase AmpD
MSKKAEEITTTEPAPTAVAVLGDDKQHIINFFPTGFDKTEQTKLGVGYDRRPNADAILGIVIHVLKVPEDTAGFAANAERIMRAHKESTHYLVGLPENDVVPVAQIVPPYLMAHHAGPSMGFGYAEWDQISIGVTVLVGAEQEDLDPLQWQTLTWLVKMLKRHYPAITFITRHSMIAQAEKPIDDHWLGDPGAFEAWVNTTK